MGNQRRRESKMQVDSTIGHNIREEREMRSMSREELADLMGLTISHMGLIERGERGATAVTLAMLSRIFNVPVDNFFTPPSGKAVIEDTNEATQTSSRQKIYSLTSRLDKHEMDFMIQMIKSIVSLKYNRETESIQK